MKQQLLKMNRAMGAEVAYSSHNNSNHFTNVNPMNISPKTSHFLLASSAAILLSFAATPARAALSFVQNFGVQGAGLGQFNSPYGVATDTTGLVYVADFNNNRIDRFDPANFAGTFTSFGSIGTGSSQFHGPAGVAVDGAGNVYVADYINNRINRFNPSNFAGTFTSFGSLK